MYCINLVDYHRNILPILKEKKQSNLDAFTTSFESEDEMIRSLGLDPKDFSVEVLEYDKNKNEKLPFLTNKFRNVINLESKDTFQFLDDLSKCDRESLRSYYVCELLGRFIYADDDYNLFRKEKLEDIIDAFDAEEDYIKIHDDLKYTDEQIKDIIKPYYFDKYGKPVYSQFKDTFYRFVSNGELKYETSSLTEKEEFEKNKKISEIKPIIEKYLDMGRKYFEEGKLNKKEYETIEIDEQEEEFDNFLSENKYLDIDDFETDLGIKMDEMGLSEDEKRITREKTITKRNRL